MANDAMLISVDRIRFMWPRSKKLRVYAVGIAADNRGKVMVTEPPSVAGVRHLPNKGRPSEWDFAGDGYPLYQRTGGLPDIVAAHLLVVRDRRGVRKVGEVVNAVAGDNTAKRIIGKASDALKKSGAGGLAAASSLGLLLPVAEAVGAIVGKHNDQIIQTISGSMFLDKYRKKQDAFSQSVRSPDSNMEVEVDVFLFDAAEDKDSIAETKQAESRLAADGLLFVKAGRK
jgi:hypothetical protein